MNNDSQVPSNQQPPASPNNIELQLLPGVTPNESTSNVQILQQVLSESTSEGNKSEAQVTSQIILIASAILVIVGVFALDPGNAVESVSVAALLTIAIIGLGVSLLSGVLHFALERSFWYKNREKMLSASKMISKMSNQQDREAAASQALDDVTQESNRVAFWFQMISFIIGILALLFLITAKVISKG